MELWFRKLGSVWCLLAVDQRARLGRQAANILFVLGALFLLGAAAYSGYALLNTWLMVQDRFLMSSDIAPLAVPAMTSTPSPSPTSSPLPTHTATPLPTLTPALTPTPLPPPRPVQIRIPAIGVSRSIIELTRIRDRQTGAWTWDPQRLFRAGRSDLVGHWQGSAYPGESGNVVLVGHNYGYGYNGVFARLGSLRTGHQVFVVNQVGETFTYQVTTVNRVRWRKKDFGELTQHLSFLTPGGNERVTLVSCAGADLEPFPERVYIVAERVE